MEANVMLEKIVGGRLAVSIVNAGRILDLGSTKIREAVAKGKLPIHDPLRSLSDGQNSKGKKLILVEDLLKWVRSCRVQTVDVDTINTNI